MKDLTKRAWVDTGASIESEKRRVGIHGSALTTLYLLTQQIGDPWPERDEAAFAELASTDDEDITFQIDISEMEPTRFTGPQAQTVAEGKNAVVSQATLASSRIVRERSSCPR